MQHLIIMLSHGPIFPSSTPLSILCATALTLVWLNLLEQPPDPNYTLGVLCFAVASIIEVLAEPLYVVGQAFLFVKLKVLMYLIFSVICLACHFKCDTFICINPKMGFMFSLNRKFKNNWERVE